jgi:hypothetical protein
MMWGCVRLVKGENPQPAFPTANLITLCGSLSNS